MTGNVTLNNNSKEINFIADSGATEHIIGKGFILSNFTKCITGKIRSSNKNQKADIKIDGKGNLYLQSNSENDTVVELFNVLTAGDIDNNLLSLRKFVDIGLCIQLDNEKIRVFDKDSGEDYITGVYEKPNWLITLKILNPENPKTEPEYNYYNCTAELLSLDEFFEQSQTDIQKLLTLEGANNTQDPDEYQSENGRKMNEEFNQSSEKDDSEWFADADLDHGKLNRKIHDLNKFNQIKYPEEISRDPEKHNCLKKISDGIQWHRRLSHASVGYLRRLQKVEENFKNVKFGDDIMECEACIMGKMTRLPFTESRERA